MTRYERHDVRDPYWRVQRRADMPPNYRLYCSACHRRVGVIFSGTLAAGLGASPSWSAHLDERYNTPPPAWYSSVEFPMNPEEPVQ